MGSIEAAYKFHVIRLLTVLGWRLSIRALTLVGVILAATAGVTLFAVSLLILRLLGGVLTANGVEGSSAGTVAASIAQLALGACLYVYLGALTREVFTARRLAVRLNPNTGLYRANDIAMRDLYLVEAGPRAILLFGISGGVCLAALTVLRELGQDVSPWTMALLAAPFTVVSSWLAVSSHLATRDPRLRRVAVVYCAASAGAVAAFILGVLAANIAQLFSRSEFTPALRLTFPGLEGPWVALTAGVTTIVSTAVTLRNLWYLKNNSFPVEEKVPRQGARIRNQTKIWGRNANLFRFLFLNIIKDKSFLVFRGIGICFFLGSSAFLGTQLGGGLTFLPDARAFQNSLAFLVFAVSMIASEALSRANNPIGLLPQLRNTWEAGYRVSALAGTIILSQALPLLILASPIIPVGALSGMNAVWLFTLLVPWTIATSNIIGNSLSLVRIGQADGSMEMSLAAAFMAVLLAVPILGFFLIDNVYSTITAIIYTALLTGGAKFCLERRILSLR